MIDRKPQLIAKCADVADVVTAVRFGRKHDLRVSIEGRRLSRRVGSVRRLPGHRSVSACKVPLSTQPRGRCVPDGGCTRGRRRSRDAHEFELGGALRHHFNHRRWAVLTLGGGMGPPDATVWLDHRQSARRPTWSWPTATLVSRKRKARTATCSGRSAEAKGNFRRGDLVPAAGAPRSQP